MTDTRGHARVLGVVLCCWGLLLPATAAALQQPDYLRKHCPIAVTVDVFAGHVSGHKAGLSLQGVQTQAPVGGFPEPAVKYTWQLSKRDKLCGIVGTETSVPVSETSLMPTTATARSGSYIDWSVNDPNPSDKFEKFTVYAKPVAPRASRSSRPAATAPPLHSVRYLERHCPIEVPVNVFVPGGKSHKEQGVTVQGQKINSDVTTSSSSYPIVKYTWQLSKRDQFCGIVGAWYGPKYVSLRPTSQTARSGEYIDYSQKDAASPKGSLQEFFVFARRKAG